MGREGVSKLLGVLRPVNHYGYIKARGEKERHLKKRGGKKKGGYRCIIHSFSHSCFEKTTTTTTTTKLLVGEKE